MKQEAEAQAALVFALAIAAKRGWVDDAEIAAARTAGLDDGAIAEIVAHTTFSNYFNHVAGTEIDFPHDLVYAASTIFPRLQPLSE